MSSGTDTTTGTDVNASTDQTPTSGALPDGELNAMALEAALPTLTQKLSSLSASLSDEERAVLSSIVTSASLHLKTLQDINVEAQYSYAKPISAAATPSIRAQLVDLPDALGYTAE